MNFSRWSTAPERLTEEELLDQMGYYYDFTNAAFEILSNDIVKKNYPFINPVLYIDPNKDAEYMGSTRYGAVTIALFKIFAKTRKVFIIDSIITIITHELFHSIQLDDSDKYITDDDYHDEVENKTNLLAWNYIKNNRNFIECSLGIDLNIRVIKIHFLKRMDEIRDYDIAYQTGHNYWLELFDRFTSFEMKKILEVDDLVVHIGDNIISDVKISGEFVSPSRKFLEFITVNSKFTYTYSWKIQYGWTWTEDMETKIHYIKFIFKEDYLIPMVRLEDLEEDD